MCVRSHCIEIELRSPDCHWFDGTLKGLRWIEADKWFRFKPNGDISENFRKGPYSKVLPCKGKHNCVSFNFQFCFKIRDLQTSQTHKGRGSVTLLSLPCLNKKKKSIRWQQVPTDTKPTHAISEELSNTRSRLSKHQALPAQECMWQALIWKWMQL